MNKQKVREIVKFSIRQNIQNKWFVIFNVFIFLFVLIIANAGNISNFLESNNISLFNDEITIEYVDNENLIGEKIIQNFKDEEKITINKIEKNDYTSKDIPDNLVVVEANLDDEKILTGTVTSKEGLDSAVYDRILKALEEARLEVFSSTKNISEEDLEMFNAPIEVDRVMLGVNAENSDTKQIIQYVSTILVYMISIFIFSKIANEIASEKVSKSIEYVLTSVTAKEYLLAKIISTIAIVLIQGIYALAYYFIGSLISSIINLSSFEAVNTVSNNISLVIDKDIVEYVLIVFVYAVLTIVLMAIIQSALSSKTTSMSEAGNSMTFLMVVTVAVYVLTFSLINPYTNMTPFIYILSCIPLVSNYFIPAIIIIGQATPLQIIVSLLLLIISIPIAFNICAKVFKNGVLDYKSNKKTKKAKKELTLKEEQELKIAKSSFRRLAFVIGMSIVLMLVLQILTQVLAEILVRPLLEVIVSKNILDILLTILVSTLGMLIPALFVLFYAKGTKNQNTEQANEVQNDLTQNTEINNTEIDDDLTSDISKESKEKSKNLKLFAISIFLVAILQILLLVAQQFLGLENNASEYILEIEGLNNLPTIISFIIEVAVIPAIFEELYFRKALISLNKKFGDKFAILISAIIFGLIHMNISQGIFAFFMGLILGNIYVKTGKMRYNMAIHFLNNGYAALGTVFVMNNLNILYYALDIIVLILITFCGIILISELYKKIKAKEPIFNRKEKIFPNNFKYVFTDFTLVLSMIFVACMFITTEALLRML